METIPRPEAYYQFNMETTINDVVRSHVIGIELNDDRLTVYDKSGNLPDEVCDSVNERVNSEVIYNGGFGVKETKTGLWVDMGKTGTGYHIGWEKLCERIREIINFEVENNER